MQARGGEAARSNGEEEDRHRNEWKMKARRAEKDMAGRQKTALGRRSQALIKNNTQYMLRMAERSPALARFI